MPIFLVFSRETFLAIILSFLRYQRKWANALLDSAILWVSSRFFTALPLLLAASMISPARRSAHGALTTGTGIGRQPTQTEGLTTGGTDLHRHLIGGTADAAGLGLQAGHDILHGLVENIERLVAGLVLDHVERAVDDLLGDALLAVEHHAVDELGHQDAVVHRIGQNFSLGNITSSGHFASLLLII